MSTDVFTLRTPVPVSADALFAWHARPAAFFRLVPPWEQVTPVAVKGPFGNGQTVTVRTPIFGPIQKTWTAELYDVEPGRRFRDRQLHGPFAAWNHTHEMIPDGPDRSTLEDHVEYRVPLGLLGHALGAGGVRHRLSALFAYRHALTESDLRRHAQFHDRPRLRVMITGARGLIGADLSLFLAAGGHEVVRLTRGAVAPSSFDDGTTTVTWNPDAPDPALFEGVDAVVHLAGDSLAAGRWDDAKKARILESRTGPTRRLAEAIAKSGRPKVFVCASAVGFYGDRGDEELDESSRRGTGFLADVCEEWEAATEPAGRAGARVVNTRFGVVLSPKNGALAKQLPAFRAGGGAVLGAGTQWLSWVSIGDVVGALHHALMTEALAGPVNVVTPFPVTNREFGRVLARVLSRPYLLTVPAPALRVLFGEMADSALLASTRVVPRRLAETGFQFDYPRLEDALRFVLGRLN
ncbi:TIGR01777 family oxidoreductase [Fimbriiglobus ruber]|uniref:Cell division inhibitor n=1 Tax=Fimbriiglobus ruber TaxID=1908690 RepID=A0A225DLG3_9BACT|nr:TIGR01777 family oxidoreductase [Fimbriiglobus ruber]OWK38039.1 Cell division inhibitor [Fimbriiglobus ruber]